MGSQVKLNIVDRRRTPTRFFDVGELGVADGEGVVFSRVEVRELIDAIQHIADQLLEKHAGRNADSTTQLARDSSRELGDIGVVDKAAHSICIPRLLKVNVPRPAADLAQQVEVEAR